MKEICEFRVVEEFAHKVFAPSEGKRLGDSVRKVEIATDDPRFEKIGVAQTEIRATTDRSFFYGWTLRRHYTPVELQQSQLFHLRITSTFEPPGELCGTVYDESTACPQCGAGATQVSDLRLDLRKAPKTKDIARTIAGEIIISQRMAELLTDAGVRRIELRRVPHKARYDDDPLDLSQVPTGRKILEKAKAAGAPHPTGRFWVWLNRAENRTLNDQAQAEYAAMRQKKRRRRQGKPAPAWYQLVPASVVEILPPTRVGIDPFDEDTRGECRCPCGDTIGLNVLSELWISRQDFENCRCDMAFTKQYLGVRRGLLRPQPLLVISPRLRRVLEEGGMKGFRVEVVHLK